jgi:hypothetical protein
MTKKEQQEDMLTATKYGFQEVLKDEGWRQLEKEGCSFEDRRNGLLKVITSHWMRSQSSAAKKPKCTWEEYVLAWLDANGSAVNEQDVVKRMVEQFGGPSNWVLGRGMTDW